MNRSPVELAIARKSAGSQQNVTANCAPWFWRWMCPALLASALIFVGCGSETPKPAADASTKAAEPAVPPDVQSAATALLGSEVQVLAYGDLAKNGMQQMLAANVLPNTPKSVVAGTVVTRAVVAQDDNGQWTELLRVDEFMKNQKGYLALTPLQSVSAWRLQYENRPDKGLTLYLTPIKQGSNEKTLPIAVRWNPETKRYQSMDPSYSHFLNEAPSLTSPRAALR
jgi:hypothetical protein